MALPKYVSTGTISVANGATAVTGVGTAWTNIVKADDVFRVAGYSVRIASVTDNTHLTLAEAWPGTTLSGDAYEIAITYDGPEFQLRTRELLEGLNDFNAIAAITFGDIVDAAAYAPASAPDFIRTVGYAAAGDGGGALYVAAVSEPSHEGKFSITLSDAVTVQWYEIAETVLRPEMFGAVRDGSTDDLEALEFARDASAALGRVVHLLPGEYAVSDTFEFNVNAAKFIGSGAYWKARDGYTHADGLPTSIKRIGTGGTNSCTVNLSKKAVGTVGTDFTAPGTDDLLGVIFRDIHVDANAIADIGVNMYRCGNNSGDITRITAEGSVKYGFVMHGLFSLRDAYFGAFSNEDVGILIGRDNFTWSSTEAYCFDCELSFDVYNNGTGVTYVAGSGTDQSGCGFLMQNVGRGSVIEVTSQGNEGRAFVWNTRGNNYTLGPCKVIPRYLENNGDGPRIDIDAYSDGVSVEGGFIHPGNGGSLVAQTIRLNAYTTGGVFTTDEGPTDHEKYPRFRNLRGSSLDHGGTGFIIDSNTVKYVVEHCDADISYANKEPSAPDDRRVTSVATGSAVALTTATSKTIATLSLDPGDWDVSGWVIHISAATTNVTRMISGISETTDTLDTTTPFAMFCHFIVGGAVPGTSNQNFRHPIGPLRVHVAPGTTKTMNLVVQDTFTLSTQSAAGAIQAKRVGSGS